MAPKIDLTQKRIGRFVVQKSSFERSTKDWLCLCDCGTSFIRRQIEIVKGLVYECPNCSFRRSEFYIGGKKFGRLHVLHEYKMDEWNDLSRKNGKKAHRIWKCKCECGTEKWISQQSITREKTISCGCYMQKNNSRYANDTLYPCRGLESSSRKKGYHIWITLLQKCYNNKYSSYKNWGAKGYTVCELWKNSSHEFCSWLHANNWDYGLTIDCKEGEKVFSPSSCKLIPFGVHCHKFRILSNESRYAIEYLGKSQSGKKWASELKIPYKALLELLKQNAGDLKKCIEIRKKFNLIGSGCHNKRNDVSNEKIRYLYEIGKTIREIEEELGFQGVHRRLEILGVKRRPKGKRSKN